MDMEDYVPTDVDGEMKETNPTPQKRQKTGETSFTATVFQFPSLVEPKPVNINWLDITSRLYNLATVKDSLIPTKSIQLLQNCFHFNTDDVKRAIRADIDRFSGLVDIFRFLYTSNLNTCSDL